MKTIAIQTPLIVTKINDHDFLKPQILSKIKSIDPVGKFEPSEVDGRQVIQYRGELNWHQLTDKMIKKGFEQNVDFDQVTGSNSYEQKEEDLDSNLSFLKNIDIKFCDLKYLQKSISYLYFKADSSKIINNEYNVIQ